MAPSVCRNLTQVDARRMFGFPSRFVSSVDLDDDFPPLSRAGLPDGMAEKKPRRPAKKSLHPDAQSDSLARGDSVNLRGGCCLAGGYGEDQEVRSASAAGPQAADRETQEADQDGSQSEAEDPAVFQFFSDEVCQHQRYKSEGTTGTIRHLSHIFIYLFLSFRN